MEIPRSTHKATIQEKNIKHVRWSTHDQEPVYYFLLSNVLASSHVFRVLTIDILVQHSILNPGPFLHELCICHLLLWMLTNRWSHQE